MPRRNKITEANRLRLQKHGRNLYISRLIKRGDLKKARGYAMMHGLPEISQGGGPVLEGQAESVNSSTLGEIKFKNYSDEELRIEVERRGMGKRVDGECIWKVDMESEEEGARRREKEREVLPEFRPAREVLPKGCRWGVVTGVGGVNWLLREVRFEDNGKVGALWLTQRQAARGMGGKGRWVAVEWDDSRVATVEGNWKLWVRK
jgi:hypothetical protein